MRAPVVHVCPAYLAIYNVASAVGWAHVLKLVIEAFAAGATPLQLWNIIEWPLKIVQSMAGLEMLHSALGLVRSPLATTMLQVSSRLILLWCYTAQSSSAQNHWSLYLMAGRCGCRHHGFLRSRQILDPFVFVSQLGRG